MRQLARRLSRVADSSASSPAEEERRGGVNKAPRAYAAAAAEPVHVGEVSDGEVERFLVRAELLGRPALAHLLGRAALEYGYDHHGPLRIPCSPAAFRRAPASLDEP